MVRTCCHLFYMLALCRTPNLAENFAVVTKHLAGTSDIALFPLQSHL